MAKRAASKNAVEKVSNEEAEKMINSGEAQLPPEAVFSMDEEIGKGLTPKQESSSSESEIAKHPKFDKFKKGVN